MTTQKKTRRWLVVLAVPAALILLLALAAKFYFTDDRLRSLIIPEIDSATGRTAGVESFSLTLFPDIGITAGNLTLSNPPGNGYPHPYFLSLGRLFIDVKLLPLFSGNLEINRIVIEDPVVYLDVMEDGRKNFTAGGGARRVAGADQDDAVGGTRAFLLANMEIRNGRIEAFNRKLDTRWIVSGLNQALSMESPGGANAIMITGQSRIDSFSYGSESSWTVRDLPVSADLSLSYRPNDDWLDFKNVRIRVRDIPLAVSGSVRDLQKNSMTLDLSVDSPDLELGHLLSLLPAGEGAGDVTATGNVRFSMKILGISSDDLNPSVTASFSVSGGTARYASLSGSIADISVDGTLEIPQAEVGRKDIGDLRVGRFTARMGVNEVSGKLRVRNFGDPDITGSFRGEISLGEIGAYYPLPEGTALAGHVSSDISLSGKSGDPRNMRASGTLSMKDVGIASPALARPLRDLNGRIKFNNRLLEMNDLSFLVGGSDVHLDASLDNYLGVLTDAGDGHDTKPQLNFTFRSGKLRTADLSGDNAGPAVESAGKEPVTPPTGLPLLPGFDMAGTVAIDSLITEKYTFTGTRGTVSSSGGIVTIHQLRLDAFDGSVSTSGTLDLLGNHNRSFDLRVDVDGAQSHSLLEPVTTFSKYLFGKLNLSSTLKGTLDDTLGIRLATLSGDGDALISGGRLTGVPLLQSLSRFLNSDRLNNVDFRTWTQKFSVADGRVKIDSLKIGGTDADLTVNGYHGLNGSLDYSLRVRIPEGVAERIHPAGVAGELLEFFRDKEGGMNFDFLVTGQTDAPVLKLDTRVQEELLRKKLKDAALKNLSDPLKKAAEGLKKLIKPKP